MRENELLEGVDLVLEGHEVRDGFISSRNQPKHGVEFREPYPSFGSLIDLRLIYSSYSKRPASSINTTEGLECCHVADR